MKIDPISVVYAYLNSRQEFADAVAGDLVGRWPEHTTIYIEHAGGVRMVRDRMDRADISYQVYAKERVEAVELAYLLREALLEDLPGRVFAGAQVLDTSEVVSPHYSPDLTSREHVYIGQVAVFYAEA